MSENARMASRLWALFFFFIALAAAYCIVAIQVQNTTFDQLAANRLPGAPSNADLAYTGIGPLDKQISGMLYFAWIVVDGTSPTLSMFGIYLIGQVVPCSTIVLVEGLRKGSERTVFRYSTAWSLLYQCVPWGIIMPIYYATQRWTTPSSYNRKSLFADPAQLSTLPIATTVGLIIPTILMALPSPEWTTSAQHNAFIALWQPFPLWIAISQSFLQFFAPSTSQTATNSMKSLRRLYTFSIAVSALTHLTILLISLNPGFFVKYSMLPASAEHALNPTTLFLSRSPFNTKDVSLRQGCLNLLQYDVLFACGSSLLYGLVEINHGSPAGAGTILKRLGLFVVLGLLIGPGGAAVAAIWERDEAVLGEDVKGAKEL